MSVHLLTSHCSFNQRAFRLVIPYIMQCNVHLPRSSFSNSLAHPACLFPTFHSTPTRIKQTRLVKDKFPPQRRHSLHQIDPTRLAHTSTKKLHFILVKCVVSILRTRLRRPLYWPDVSTSTAHILQLRRDPSTVNP